MRAIEKAWKENLKESKDNQWESKEDLIENCCPYDDEDKLSFKGFKDNDELCSYYHQDCTECWNTEVEEDVVSKYNVNNNFGKLDHSPITSINIYDANEEELERSLERNSPIIFADNTINYSEIHSLIKWLQEVYDYCTELKNKVEYVNWQTARKHMEKGNKAQFKGCVYRIQLNALFESKGGICSFSGINLSMIDSEEWILL